MLSYKQKRINFSRFETKSKILKSIVQNRSLKSSIRWYFNIKFSQYRKSISKVRIKNRCVLSNRSRGLYRFARLSRLFLRDNQYIGSIPGLRKSYW